MVVVGFHELHELLVGAKSRDLVDEVVPEPRVGVVDYLLGVVDYLLTNFVRTISHYARPRANNRGRACTAEVVRTYHDTQEGRQRPRFCRKEGTRNRHD